MKKETGLKPPFINRVEEKRYFNMYLENTPTKIMFITGLQKKNA